LGITYRLVHTNRADSVFGSRSWLDSSMGVQAFSKAHGGRGTIGTVTHPAAGSWMDGHQQEIRYVNPQSSNRNGVADRMDTWSSRSIWEQSNAAGVSQTFEQLSNVDNMPSSLPSQDWRLSWVPDRKCDSNFIAYIIKIVIQLLPRSRTSCHL
jgi:hypothetical protein